jgi:hypothetical protein
MAAIPAPLGVVLGRVVLTTAARLLIGDEVTVMGMHELERPKVEHGVIVRRVPVGYTPSVPAAIGGGPDRGGPAIARSGRIVRPERRPSDQQTRHRRRAGGFPREICNQVPSHEARDFLILGPAGLGAPREGIA